MLVLPALALGRADPLEEDVEHALAERAVAACAALSVWSVIVAACSGVLVCVVGAWGCSYVG